MALAFKPNIDDSRESPAKYIAQKSNAIGAKWIHDCGTKH